MRAISSFSREAGISTFWCQAWSAFRTRVSMSATGSVNLIVYFSLSHPFAPGNPENLRQLASLHLRILHFPLVILSGVLCREGSLSSRLSQVITRAAAPLPRRLRNPRNLPAQRQPAEAQPANAELAQESPRPSAQFAAVMPPRGKLRLGRLGIARLLKHFLNFRVLHSFRCRHSILKFFITGL